MMLRTPTLALVSKSGDYSAKTGFEVETVVLDLLLAVLAAGQPIRYSVFSMISLDGLPVSL